METVQAPPPSIGIADATSKRSRAILITTFAVLGTGVLLWQLLGTASIFPAQTASPAASPQPTVAASTPPATPSMASQPVSTTPHYGTGLNLVPPQYRSWQVAPQPLPSDKPDAAPPKPAAEAAPTPAARDALPMQTSVITGKAPRVGVAAHQPAVGGSGSSPRPGNADPNG